MKKSNDERGFAMAVAILALVVVGVLVTGGFFVARQETRVGVAGEHSSRAFYETEGGITEILVESDMSQLLNLSLGDSIQAADTTEASRVSATITRTGDRTFFVDGTGVVTAGGQLMGGATRRLGLMVKVASPSLDPPAALTLRGGFVANGAPNKVDGRDRDPSGWVGNMCPSPMSDKPGVLTDDADAIQTQGGGGGKGKGKGKGGGGGGSCPSQISGSPCIQEDEDAVDETMAIMDDPQAWADLLAMADHRITALPGGRPSASTAGGVCNTGDPYNWGDPDNPNAPCGRYFPVIHIDGNVSMTGNTEGQGILLVDGNFTMSGTPKFYGIILVNGQFRASNGTPDILGGVIAQSVGALNGTPAMDFSSCAATQALLNSSLTRVRPLEERSWIDLTNVGN